MTAILPKRHGPSAPARSGGAPEEAVAAAATMGSEADEVLRASILIVDDMRMIRNVMRSAFAAAGYTNLRMAANGAQALEEVAQARPDLVIVDLTMPEIDGYEVCRRLRASPATARLPILVHSAVETPEHVAAVFEAGASDLIRKPVQMPELLARARSHLERWRFEQRLVAYRSRVARELAAARRLQVGILPSTESLEAIAAATGLMLKGTVEPSTEIGGDIWGLSIDDDSVSIFLADLAGHGIVSAINAFRVHTLLNAGALDARDPAAALTQINRALCRTLETGEFATFLIGRLHLGSGELVYATAGAPPPIVASLGRAEARLCEARGLPVGVHAGATYENRRTRLEPGEFLLLYSDALTDLPGSDGKAGGWEAVRRSVEQAPRLPDEEESLRQISRLLRAQVPSPPPDDLTVVLVGRPSSMR